MSETLEQLLERQEEIDQKSKAQKELGNHIELLAREIEKTQELLARLYLRRNQARADVGACENAKQSLPETEERLAFLQEKYAFAARTEHALQVFVKALSYVLKNTPSGQWPDENVLQNMVSEIAAVEEDLPLDVADEFNQLVARIEQGQLPSVSQLKELNARLQIIIIRAKKLSKELQDGVKDLTQRLADLKSIADRLPAALAHLKELDHKIQPIEERLSKLQKALKKDKEELHNIELLLPQLEAELRGTLDGLFGSLDQGIPIALLPVRLETRFISHQKEEVLAIRIYPDDIHQNQHRPQLSATERDCGESFQQRIADAAAPGLAAEKKDEMMRQAWHELAGRFGPNRAAWIARICMPLAVEEIRKLDVDPRPNVFASHANLLPDRWVAIGYRQGQVVFTEWSRLVGQKNANNAFSGGRLGTGMTRPDAPKDGLDENARWLVDFDRALDVGMAIRVQRKASDDSFDRILVFGVRATWDSEQSALGLENQFDAHHYTWGIGFISRGTPTNNTAEASSGHSRHDHGYEASYGLETGPQQVTPYADDGSEGRPDGFCAAEALGIGCSVFDHVANAGSRTESLTRALHTALWPATLEYFLEIMLGRGWIEALHPPNLDGWRNYFMDYVRGGGPLPLLRIGNQPYGMLPVTSLESWQPSSKEPWSIAGSGWRDFLKNLRDKVWLNNRVYSNTYPSIPLAQQAKVDEALLKILGMSGISVSERGRVVATRDVANQAYETANYSNRYNDYQKWDSLASNAHSFLKSILGLSSAGQNMLEKVFVPGTFECDGPLVQSKRDIPHDYIKSLFKIDNVRDMDTFHRYLQHPPPETPLLQLLLIFAFLRTYVKAGEHIDHTGQAPNEPNEVDASSVTPWKFLTESKAVSSGNGIAAELFHSYQPGGANADEPAAKILEEFYEALRPLTKASPEELERLLVECLDLCSHRLDAWITSLATLRLKELRDRSRKGVYVGAYGWIENLRLKAVPDSDGYIHAPSLTHAATAAILRSGYLSHEAKASEKGLAMQLTSSRVRKALWLIDGVRQGQPLAALLGYAFERALQTKNLELMQHLPALRQRYPLNANKLTSSKESLENIAAYNVIDGLKMVREYPEEFPFGLKFKNRKERKELAEVLDELIEGFDAVSDLAIAEAVHQVAQGNPVRAAASLDAVSRGEVPLHDLDVIRTPRTGVTLTHRLLVAFSYNETPDDAGPWEPTDSNGKSLKPNARRIAEPVLNRWAATFFCKPEDILCKVNYIDAAAPKTSPPAKPLHIAYVSLRDLGLGPLDLLYTEIASPDGHPSELEQRVVYHALVTARPDTLGWERNITVSLEFELHEPSPNGSAHLNFGQALEVARAARSLVTQARPLQATDLLAPGSKRSTITISLKTEEALTSRIDVLCKILSAAKTALESELSKVHDKEKPDLNDGDRRKILGDRLLALADLGIANAVPFLATSASPKDWLAFFEQCDGALKAAEDRLEALRQAAASGDVHDRLRHHVDRLKVLFGAGFQIIPPFVLEFTGNDKDKPLQDLKRSRDSLSKILSEKPEALDIWFLRAARVRDGARRLHNAMHYVEAINHEARLDFQVMQLPFTGENEPWVGGPCQTIPSNRISLVVHDPFGLDFGHTFLAGLLIDSWNEVVPNASETTAVTFHYDAPGATAPQALLLAVSPNPSEKWSVDLLATILLETMDLVRMRTVTLPIVNKAVPSLSQFLPALYFPVNPAGDTVGVVFKNKGGE